MMLFPVWMLTRRILLNALLIWIGLRFGAAIIGVVGTNLLVAAGFVTLTSTLAQVDVRRRSRHLLLENLGVSGVAVGLVATLPPFIFESALLLVVRS